MTKASKQFVNSVFLRLKGEVTELKKKIEWKIEKTFKDGRGKYNKPI